MNKLLQVSINEVLLEKIKRVANSKGLNTSAFVKLVLVNQVQNEDANLLTENGFRKKEEDRIIESWENIKSSELESGSVNDFLNNF